LRCAADGSFAEEVSASKERVAWSWGFDAGSGEVWESDALKARLARIGLFPLSCLYTIGWEGYLAIYRFGLKKAQAPHSPVLCVGNLVTGGSGKSPATLRLATILTELGYSVVIGCSGYGAPHAEAATLAPSGPLSAKEWGDEPAMFRWLRPDLPLVVGRRRVLAAQLAHEAHPNAVLLMDDGFQHLPVKKDFTILLDEENPRNRLCLPAGPYREPRFNRKRADLVLPRDFRILAQPLSFVNPEGNVVPNPAAYSVLCALGQPARFLASLEANLGGTPMVTQLLPDHDPLDRGTLLDSLPREVPVIVTAKDWVKIRERDDWSERSFLIARHEIRFEPEAKLRDWLTERLHGRTA
jgi:tetraacyldisaccharide 4'-kinase